MKWILLLSLILLVSCTYKPEGYNENGSTLKERIVSEKDITKNLDNETTKERNLTTKQNVTINASSKMNKTCTKEYEKSKNEFLNAEENLAESQDDYLGIVWDYEMGVANVGDVEDAERVMEKKEKIFIKIRKEFKNKVRECNKDFTFSDLSDVFIERIKIEEEIPEEEEDVLGNRSLSEKDLELLDVFNSMGLALKVGDKLVFDDPFTYSYFITFGNRFVGLSFTSIDDKIPYQDELRIGEGERKMGTIRIGNKNYIIDPLGCEDYEKICTFRINGILYPDISPNQLPYVINIDSSHKLVMRSIEFDRCMQINGGNCDEYYDTLDIIKIEIAKG